MHGPGRGGAPNASPLELHLMTFAHTPAADEGGLSHGTDENLKSHFERDVTTRPTVYVVDDDESMCMGLAGLLGAAGYRVEAFGSALDFLALPSRRPGCVVLDL